jgi:predicted TIM-barrel fold metal-dependent hydrolase
MKIDFHVHITPPDIIANWKKYAEKEPYFAQLCNSRNNRFATAEEVIGALEAENALFERAVVFGFAFRDLSLCRYVNDYVIEKAKQYPKRLTGFCVVSPCGEGAKEIERCYSHGLAGVGELFPQGQGFDPANEKETALITDVCEEFDIPLLLHANEPVGHLYPGKTDVTLKHLETFVANNPELKIILAHWGGGLFFYETMGEIKEKFKNVYYDTAATPFLYDERIYNIAKTMGLCEKILFGSDFPLLQHSRYITAIEKSGLSTEEKQLIFGGNAEKLLKI